MIRTIALFLVLVAGCAVASTPPTSSPAARSASTPSRSPSAPASAAPVPEASGLAAGDPATDEEIAAVIRAGAEVAVPQLRSLNGSDPSRLDDLFIPLGVWIDGQRAAISGLTPSACTADAVTLYLEGIDGYDAIRKEFLAWRDWGAHGHAFPPGAPRMAAAAIDAALAELDAGCPA